MADSHHLSFADSAEAPEFKALVQPFALAGHLFVEVLPAERVGLTG